MNDKDKIIGIHSDDKVTIYHLKNELEAQGIESMIKSSYESGLRAGFVSGSQSTYQLFVLEKDYEKAKEIIDSLL